MSAEPLLRRAWLATPPLPLLVHPSVFDGFSWTPSTTLEWRCLGAELELNPLSEDPSRMAFVFRRAVDGVPAELARLHVGRAYGLEDELCLAPYAIDHATDELWRQRVEPTTALWLAADNLDAVYWGLHDWAHFHNHGDFVERAANELQCDAAALCWLWINRATLGLAEDAWDARRREVLEAHRERCRAIPPGVLLDESVIADEGALVALADRVAGGAS
jgi:hypothetical protein